MESSKFFQLLASGSRVLLALAILFLGYQLARFIDGVPQVEQTLAMVNEQLPATLETVNRTTSEVAELRKLIPEILAEVEAVRQQVPPILEESSRIRDSLPPVISEVRNVRESIPPILDEVGEVRRSLPPVVAEISEVRKSLPSVIEEVAETRRQVPGILESVNKTAAAIDNTQQKIPDILTTANRIASTVDETNTQLETLAPQVLDEVRLTRDKIDPTLDRVEILVDDAYRKAQDTLTTVDGVGREASEGAVTGFFTGILKLPFNLLGTLASPILESIDADIRNKLTQKDAELMAEAGKRLGESKAFNEPEYWRNPDSGNRGSITLIQRYQAKGLECVQTRITFNLADRTTSDELQRFCRDSDGTWKLASELLGRD